MPERDSIAFHVQEYMVRVLGLTSELFYLLEAAETLRYKIESGERPIDALNRGFRPSMLRVELSSHLRNSVVPSAEEWGPNGRLAQLAYVGWVAAVDGAWERARWKPPYAPLRGTRRHGQRANLFGDLHKIRNDLLKNGAVAQKKNTGKCVELLWFKVGEHMQMRVEHVLEFLHKLGGYLRSQESFETPLGATWYLDETSPRPNKTPRVLSNRVFVAEISADQGGPGFGLCVSMLFEDGVAWTVGVKQAANREALTDDFRALRAAPTDEYGAIISPRLGRMDVLRTHATALDAILSGHVPVDAGTPFIGVR